MTAKLQMWASAALATHKTAQMPARIELSALLKKQKSSRTMPDIKKKGMPQTEKWADNIRKRLGLSEATEKRIKARLDDLGKH